MNRLIDKLVILTLCMVCYIQAETDLYFVVPVICAVAAGALQSYFEGDIPKLLVFIAYSVVCVINPVFFYFLPVVCYDIFSAKWRYIAVLALIPAILAFQALPVVTDVFIILFFLLSFLANRRTESLERVRGEYLTLRDETKEFFMQLENKNKELMEKQDYEVNLATLNERNRIARDIHDSIGHVLSNAILQTGALLAVCRDAVMKERLDVLKGTLTEGMDSIRESIHDLHDESIDMYVEMKSLVDNFHFCEAALDYDLEGNPDNKIKYTLLAVTKEALSNIIKHSDATDVRVTLREHPALYQLIVKNNGTKKAESGDGIGLKNIAQRVNALKGNFHIAQENGFTVFVSIPKEK
jgi:signal transduction histidine kinase